jgi:hypothetical protein
MPFPAFGLAAPTAAPSLADWELANLAAQHLPRGVFVDMVFRFFKGILPFRLQFLFGHR